MQFDRRSLRLLKESAGPKHFDADELLSGSEIQGNILRKSYDPTLVLSV